MIWLDHVTLRFYPIARRSAEGDACLNTIGTMRFAGATIGLTVFAGVAVLGPDRVFGSCRSLFGVAALVFLAQTFFDRGLAMLRARGKTVSFSIASSVNAVAKVGVGLLCAFGLGFGVSGLLWGAAIVPLLLYQVFMRGLFGKPSLRLGSAARTFLSEALRYGLPVCVTLVLNYFLGNIDRYLLKYFLGDAEVGVYSIGNFIADEPMKLLYFTLMLAIFPTTAHMYEVAGHNDTEVFVGDLTRIYLLIAVPACVLLASLAHPLLFVLAKGAYRESYVVVPWIAGAAFVLGLSQYSQLGLHLSKRTIYMVGVTIIAVAVNVACNWILIPLKGYYGCGISRLASNVVLLVAFAIVSQRHFHWRFPGKSAARILAAAAIMAGTLFFLRSVLPENLITLGLLAGGGAIEYVLLLLLFRETRRDELGQVLSLFSTKSRGGDG